MEHFILHRTAFMVTGVFGTLMDSNNKQLAVTLEHSYAGEHGLFTAKIPNGVYTCKRSSHRLEGMDHDFVTFQVMDVPGYTNILFHWGNFNKDSEGCILMGQEVLQDYSMITNSKATWQAFMDRLADEDQFELIVSS